jgi:hypothetical protein
MTDKRGIISHSITQSDMHLLQNSIHTISRDSSVLLSKQIKHVRFVPCALYCLSMLRKLRNNVSDI